MTDHTPNINIIYDQGDTGACVINAFCCVFIFYINKYIRENPKSKTTLFLQSKTNSKPIQSNLKPNSKPNSNPIQSNLKPNQFRPSRYYLYNLSCSTNMAFDDFSLGDEEIPEINYTDGGGSLTELILDNIKYCGIIRELDFEKDKPMSMNCIFDNPTISRQQQLQLLNSMYEAEEDNFKRNIISSYMQKINSNSIDINIDPDIIYQSIDTWRNVISYNDLTYKIKMAANPIQTLKSYIDKEPLLIALDFSLGWLASLNIFKTTFYPSDISPTNKSLHMMVIVGYRVINNETFFKIQNSWGSTWRDNGFCYFSEDFFTKRYINNNILILHKININFVQLEKNIKILESKKKTTK